VTRRED